MKVVKRSGDVVEMLFDKVTKRISKLNQQPEFHVLQVQPDKVAQKVFQGMYDGISTAEIDNLSAEVAIGMVTEHPDYETLAMRITVSSVPALSGPRSTRSPTNTTVRAVGERHPASGSET